MNDFIKAMMLKELMTEEMIIGYRFKKKLNQQGITVSNGSIYLHLGNWFDAGYVTKKKAGKTVEYHLTLLGKEMLFQHIKTVPKDIETQMRAIAALVPNTNWQKKEDVSMFLNELNKAKSLTNDYWETL
ncbi:MAG: hypothetical protein UMR38_02870 [Candidatus Izemoplasma sp.]|nr:hypothetical protein [Candidatus Izemoplasma sp.]